MFTRALLVSALSILPLEPAEALDTTRVESSQLLELGARLEAGSGNSQWQQLWHEARGAGLFETNDDQLHFAVTAAQLPALARETLAQPDQVDPVATTLARYRRVFTPLIIGQHGEQALDALCVEVDWRALPPNMTATPEAYLGLASLRKIYPCE